jgi:hypothetical protein
MKMIKRTLIAIAVVALLVTSAQAAIDIHSLSGGDHTAVKVDGSDSVRWPWEYKALTVCSIPIKMHVGMYVQIFECKKKKLILQQVPCSDIGQGDDKYPCYQGCVKFKVRGNLPQGIKMGASLEKIGDIIGDWDKYYQGGDVVPGDGEYHEVEACVKAWNTKIYKSAPGDEVDVGKLHITVKPNA